jgi:hypothetical protein
MNYIKVISKLQNRRFLITHLEDTTIIGTPWFLLQIANNFGSVNSAAAYIWCGFKISWKWNKKRKDGDVFWMKEKTFYEFKMTYVELENYAYFKSI